MFAADLILQWLSYEAISCGYHSLFSIPREDDKIYSRLYRLGIPSCITWISYNYLEMVYVSVDIKIVF